MIRPKFDRATLAVPALLLLALGACSQADEADTATYETDTVDQSGGELIVSDADAQGVEVDVPDTAMTNAPVGAATPQAGMTETETGQTTPPSE